MAALTSGSVLSALTGQSFANLSFCCSPCVVSLVCLLPEWLAVKWNNMGLLPLPLLGVPLGRAAGGHHFSSPKAALCTSASAFSTGCHFAAMGMSRCWFLFLRHWMAWTPAASRTVSFPFFCQNVFACWRCSCCFYYNIKLVAVRVEHQQLKSLARQLTRKFLVWPLSS